MGWLKKQHKKLAAEFALEKAVDYHEAFGTTPAVYNEDEDRIEELPASAYVIMILLHSNCCDVYFCFQQVSLWQQTYLKNVCREVK